MYDGTMHRTQLMLEDWQMDALRSRAERAGISVSELVRRIVTQYLRPPDTGRSELLAMEGVGEDAEASGADHDGFLYGPRR